MEKEEEEPPTHFGKFNIFLLIKTAQQAYGIKTGDYSRYRRYCSNKIYKLRKSLGVKMGNKTKFFGKDVTKDHSNDPRTLQILLFNAEKNWALANQTKFSQTRKASQKSRARFVSIKKLSRALIWAEKLKDLTKNRTDGITELECQAYQLYLRGSYDFERQQWAQAQSKLIACRQILGDVGRASDSLSERAASEKVDQIDQTIKFCNFKMSKGKKTLSVAEIVELRKGADAGLTGIMEELAEKRLNDIQIGEASGDIHFGEERYPMKEEKIVQAKIQIDEGMSSLETIKKKWEGQMEDDQLYEQLLSFYSSLVLQIDSAIHQSDAQREDPKKREKYTQGELEIMRKVSLLFGEMRMKVFIDRNLTIFKWAHSMDRGRKSTPQTIAKLLTATSTLFNELAEVVKQKGQLSNNFQIEWVQAIDAKNFYLRTLRLLFVGRVYSNNGKLKEAYALWNECHRCLNILTSKEEMQSQRQEQEFIRTIVPLDTLMEQVRYAKAECAIANYQLQSAKEVEVQGKMKEMDLEEEGDRKAAGSTLTLERLLKDPNLVPPPLEQIGHIPILQLPGRVQPIPTRPIFFDIAYNKLAYPDVQGKAKKNTKTSWWGRLFK